MSLENHCPQIEQIAALAEGQLKGEERTAVLHHVNDCQRCFFVYNQTLEQLGETAAVKPIRTRSFKSIVLVAGLAAVIILGIGTSWMVDASKAWRETDWWHERYGEVTIADPANARAEAVFQRVAAAVPGVENASLIFLDEDSQEIALAIPGAVVLSRKAYDLCVEGVPRADGDARLALVLGHELAHLRQDELLHGFAAFNKLPAILTPQGSKAARVEAEADADQWGLLYAAQAGFNPQAILRESEPFFKTWLQRLGGELGNYPTLDERVQNLSERMEQAATAYEYFAWGVRFYQMGRFQDAQAFFEVYQQAFAGREVHNNLGLVALQQVLAKLAACDGADVIRFKLPLMVDQQTVLEGARFRGGNQSDSCLEKQEIRDGFEKAITQFSQALQQDPNYEPAKLNLASTYILAHQTETAMLYTNAMGSSRQAQVLKALAVFIFADEKDSPTDREEALEQLIEMASNESLAAYNAASITQLLGRDATALWELFLTQEAAGPYAAIAREQLGLEIAESPAMPVAMPELPLGIIKPETQLLLDKMANQTLKAGANRFTTYRNQQSKILVQENKILIVERQIAPPVSLESFLAGGSTGMTMLMGRGKSVIGRGWVLDVEAGQVVRILAYAADPESP